MRFMILVKASRESEAGVLPSAQLVADMQRFNEEMVAAGVMQAGEGLQPSSKGTRIRFSGKERTVTDGPFPETKELLAGFWMIQVRDHEEAMRWALRIPFDDGEVEVRQVFEAADFPADVLPPEAAAREQAMRDELQKRAGGR